MKRGLLLVALLTWLISGVAQDLGKTEPANTLQELKEALRRATNEMEYHPDSVELRLRKAALNMQLEQWQVAKDEYDEVLRLQAGNLTALYFRAYANERLRRYSFARLDYEELLRLVPGNFNAMLGLALLNQKDHHLTEAADQLSLMVSMFPDSAVVYAARANLECERGQLDPADYDYSEALRLEPENRDWLLAHFDVLLALGRRNEARAKLDRLVALGVARTALEEYYRKVRS